MTAKIMVVEDDLGLLTLFQIMLEQAGFSVLGAQDGFTALDMLKETVPDLFILDVKMPGMDGFELCRRIRAQPQMDHRPFLFLSAHGDSESVEEGFKAGAHDYLTKPIVHHDLVNKVRHVLR